MTENNKYFSNPFCKTSNGANDDVLIFLQLVILTFTFRIPSEANSVFINNGFNGVVIIKRFYV